MVKPIEKSWKSSHYDYHKKTNLCNECFRSVSSFIDYELLFNIIPNITLYAWIILGVLSFHSKINFRVTLFCDWF